MKLFKQFLYIISFTFLGEIISKGAHLPIPGSVIGMLLLFGALCLKVIKVEAVETVGTFLLENLSIFFLPAGVGIMVFFPVIKETWWSLLLITIVGTSVTMALVGRVVQGVKRKFEGDYVDLKTKEGKADVTRIDE